MGPGARLIRRRERPHPACPAHVLQPRSLVWVVTSRGRARRSARPRSLSGRSRDWTWSTASANLGGCGSYPPLCFARGRLRVTPAASRWHVPSIGPGPPQFLRAFKARSAASAGPTQLGRSPARPGGERGSTRLESPVTISRAVRFSRGIRHECQPRAPARHTYSRAAHPDALKGPLLRAEAMRLLPRGGDAPRCAPQRTTSRADRFVPA
jgi:hypothetical protein